MGDSHTPIPGVSLKIQSLYQSHDPSGRVLWLTSAPSPPRSSQIPESENPEYAITLRHRALHNKPHQQTLDSIIIRSPALRKFLDETIDGIGQLFDEDEAGLVVQAPFRILFWWLDAIEGVVDGGQQGQRRRPQQRQDGDLAAAATLLLETLHTEFAPLLQRRKTMLANGEINFDTLWTLFKPGITCVTAFLDSQHAIAVKCLAIDFGRHAMGGMYYRIKYENLVWGGESLGWRDDYTDILEFKGRRKVRGMQILPVEFWEGEGSQSIAKLAARGRRFLDLVVKEPYMMRFSGESLDTESSPMWWQGSQKQKLSERVILDARAYSHYFRRLAQTKWRGRDELDGIKDELTLAYVFPELHVFGLQRKRWARVWVDDVDEVVFDDAAYPSLVLPNDYKQLLLAFAEAQIDAVSGAAGGFDDVIAGKGQGILMLLAGPPGTGKTLTAEAMAEHMRRPLYSVSTGELGLAAQGMENELNKVLELSTRWNAVLLLDEADVFLERRADNDIQRNSIVSIFLRRLEYYRGIMFLTTNRIKSFDEAFRSRIHVAIQYPDLDSKARYSIWANFLERSKEIYRFGVEIRKAEVEELARKTLNGREIRNIVKSAQLLASRSKEPLSKKHVDIVWRVEMENSPWKGESAA